MSQGCFIIFCPNFASIIKISLRKQKRMSFFLKNIFILQKSINQQYFILDDYSKKKIKLFNRQQCPSRQYSDNYYGTIQK